MRAKPSNRNKWIPDIYDLALVAVAVHQSLHPELIAVTVILSGIFIGCLLALRDSNPKSPQNSPPET